MILSEKTFKVGFDKTINRWFIYLDEGLPIVATVSRDNPGINSQEAAEFIAKACTAHADLLEALKAAQPYLPHTADGAKDVLHPVLGQARAAIKKATE